MSRKFLSRSAVYFAIATFAVSLNCAAQDKPIDVEISAGLSIPVGEDELSTGMTLGGTVGYGLTETIAATGALLFNRYTLERSVLEGHFPIVKVLGGIRYTTPQTSQLRYFGTFQLGFARSEENFDNVGETPTKRSVDIDGDSSTDFTFRLGGGVLYDFTDAASVGVSAHFNGLGAQDASHIDLPVFFVRFGL